MGQILLELLKTLLLSGFTALSLYSGFTALSARDMQMGNYVIQAAMEYGKASVTVDTINTYEEVPFNNPDGDVFKIDGTDIKVKINGAVVDDTMTSYGYVSYAKADSPDPIQFNFEIRKNDIVDFHNACISYWHDDCTELPKFYGMPTDGDNIIYYQQTYKNGNIPCLYSKSAEMYYMLIDCGDSYIVASSAEPFIVTTDKVTVHYGNPTDDPMTMHTYSDYEALAAANTIRELQEQSKGEGPIESPYDPGDVVGTADTFTSKEDNDLRRQMVSYKNYTWDVNGNSSETTMKIDITSEEAKKSQWKLTATSYVYEKASLRISALSAKRTDEEFSLSGNINNMLGTDRPYVVVVKFLSAEGQLLALEVVDGRSTPIKANGVTSFGVSLKTSEDVNAVPIDKITSVQFEIH